MEEPPQESCLYDIMGNIYGIGYIIWLTQENVDFVRSPYWFPLTISSPPSLVQQTGWINSGPLFLFECV